MTKGTISKRVATVSAVLCLGALGLAGPSARLSPDEVIDHLERLREAAVELAMPLGLDVPELVWP